MKKSLLLIPLAMSLAAHATAAETAAQKAARMKWFNESRFGMFIHWGLYSIPAGEWPGKGNRHAEWIRETAQIPVGEYEKLMPKFNPVKYDPDKIVRMAKAAGMKYIVITTKHHDGFQLFDSQYSDWNVRNTPYKKDLIKPLAEACKKYGLKMCFYHSIMDWHHPDYLPRRSWEAKDRPADGADFRRFVTYLRNQVSELLTKYGPVGVMWFDGEWESTWNHKDGQELYDLCRKLQPNVIVNNRVDTGRAGLEGFAPSDRAGDYGTPEQTIPASGMGAGNYWETCMTMNDNWGFNKADKNFKDATDVVRKLCDIASKGGNFLLNVGPDALGEVPMESQKILADVGKWMDKCGEAIYETQASPWNQLPKDYRITVKPGTRQSTIYQLIHAYKGDLTINGLGNEVVRADLLNTGQPVRISKMGPTSWRVSLPSKLPASPVFAVRIIVKGAPVVYQTPTLDAASSRLNFYDKGLVVVKGMAKGMEIRQAFGREPKYSDPTVFGPIDVTQSGTVMIAGFLGTNKVTDTLRVQVNKVDLNPAGTAGTRDGMVVNYYHGEYDTLAQMLRTRPESTGILPRPEMCKELQREHWGATLEGTFDAPSDDVYEFALTSDDGSRLYIDGKLVVDHDGLHSSETKAGFIGLARGAHKIRVEYFNKTGGAELNILWRNSRTKPGPMGRFKF